MRLFSTNRELLFLLTHPPLWFRKSLETSDLDPDPFKQFAKWFKRAEKSWTGEFHNWLCLSTLNPDGYPEGRIVLLKSFNADGFVFYTNTESKKGQALEANPRAGMTFYWEKLQWQVRIVGDVTKVSDSEADLYFASRPKNSQIGAWASRQSSRLNSRQDLIDKFSEYEKKYQTEPVTRPPYWTGYRLNPICFEFWELRLSRLHDRFCYQKSAEDWTIERLSP
jgi:pyridoxamine 5'-phosphate oxidase